MKKIIIPLMFVMFFVPVELFAVNIIYVNGINNTPENATTVAFEIASILKNSINHQENPRNFSVKLVYNPLGFYGSTKGFNLKQDRMELFLLKTAEEIYAKDFEKIVVPYNGYQAVDQDAAKRIVNYLNDMTPGTDTNYLETERKICDEDMLATQNTVFSIVAIIKELGSAVVISHSQGNLLVNLAYADIVAQYGEDAWKMMRVVNVANTSEFSPNNLNFTHAGDAALYSLSDSLDISLEAMPSQFSFWRVTPRCKKTDYINFNIAAPTFQEVLSGIGFLRHSFRDAYLSNEPVILIENSSYNFFTANADTFADRFEDFVYVAAQSLENANLDGDGDGYSENVDCDDADNSVWQTSVGYVDSDRDGYGSGSSVSICSGYALPSGYALNNKDCDDKLSSIHPEAEELCNGIDDNCDGDIEKECDIKCSDPRDDYVDNCNGTVSDASLMWQKMNIGHIYSWSGARAYCTNLVFAGYDDWHLPTIKELETLVRSYTPAISPIFGHYNMDSNYNYWSSSKKYEYPFGWTGFGIYFRNGSTYNLSYSNKLHVRCVRCLE